MTTTGRMLGLMVILAVPPAFAEKAVPRDDSSSSSSGGGHSGGGGGGGSSHSGGSSDSGGSSSSGSSGSSSSRDRAVPRDSGSSDHGSVGRHSGGSGRERNRGGSSGGYAETDAERRSPRPRTTRGEDDGYGRGSRGGRVLYGHYGAHYHGSVYYPYSCYDSHYSYWDYPYRTRYYNNYDPTGAVRVLVDPKETKVYVDGYYAGIADDFDGIFQRLYLPPGRHEIALKLPGYKTHRVQIYSARGHTIKLHHDMAPGEGEDEPEDMVGPLGEEDDAEANLREGEDTLNRELNARSKGGLGTLRLSVNPKDAAVYVDGEFWGNGIREDLKLPAGRHEIAVVRPGFESFERQVEIRADDTVEVDVDLKKS